MAISTSPYHSTDVRDPRVYHDYSDCPSGQQIDRSNWSSGQGDLPRCGNCKRLD